MFIFFFIEENGKLKVLTLGMGKYYAQGAGHGSMPITSKTSNSKLREGASEVKQMTCKQIRLRTVVVVTAVGLGAVFGFSLPVAGQGICVADTLKVTAVSGKVVLKFKNGEQALTNASVTLRRTNIYGRVVAKQSVSGDGSFSFKHIRPGKYLLIASEPRFTDFYLGLKVERSEARGSDQDIVVVMDVNSAKECSGGYAELRAKKDDDPPR